jgi:uncharacterized membrane protein
MNRLSKLFRPPHRDERGATLILVAAAMAVLLPVGLAFTVEIGEDTVVNRSLQTAADAGAVDGARYLGLSPDISQTIAGQAVLRNYPGVAYTTAEGSWTSGGGFVSSATCEASSTCTAIQVITSGSVKHLFESGSSSLSKSSVATRYGGSYSGCVAPCNPLTTYYGESGFSIGTYLASFSTAQSQVLNSLLGNLGTSVTLTAVGYSGLANTWVSVQNLIDASGGVLTPSNVLTMSLTGAQWNSFLTSAVTTQVAPPVCSGSPVPYPCTAKTSLTTLGGSVNGSTSASLCQMVSINGSSCSSGNLQASALSASVNVLQLLTTEGELANGSTGLDVKSALNLGVAAAKLVTSLIQVPQVAYGPVGTSASTSQINVDLQLTLLGSLNLLDIPISGADGTATLAAINCTNNVISATNGNIIDANTTVVSNSITLLGANIASIAVNGAPNQPLKYTVVPPTTMSENNSTNPQTIVAMPATFTVSGLSFVNQLLVGGILNGLTSSLGPVLQALGVNVAGAQVADLSTDCAAASVSQ